MSDARDPAIALIEFSSIAVGIVAGDAMVKASPLGSIYTGTVHPGKYLVLVSGDTASVDEGLSVGLTRGGGHVIASVFLPDIHPDVTTALTTPETAAPVGDLALGIVETPNVAAVIDAADAGVKAAVVTLDAVRMADGLGGKGYALFSGEVADVEAALESAALRVDGTPGVIIEVIPQLHAEMAENLRRDVHFMTRVEQRDGEREA
ncbi:MAG: BMC domain-containing protein [Acidimicrobiia bacterium]|nr:BMC domain-containing protein [Acidimicrobiia bacterium]